MANHTQELRTTAKQLFIKGWTIPEISSETNIAERTLYNWRDQDSWQINVTPLTVEQVIAKRITTLVEIEVKTPAQLDELTRLLANLGDFKINIAQAEKLQAEAIALKNGNIIPPHGLAEVSANSQNSPKKTRSKQRKKTVKNDISELTQEQFDQFRQSHFFAYQTLWYERKIDPETGRTRFILKARQIGATYYFAYEAFEDAVLTGDNQIFLSASRDQAEVFKAYIIAIAHQQFNVELKGQSAIILSNGAEIRFLSTNSRTAQSYHGHLYVDEVFWIPDFKKLWKVASGMSAHKKWRRTLFSTPSAQSHQAYPETVEI